MSGLVKVLHPTIRSEPISVNRNRYMVDNRGYAIVSQEDSKILVEVGGFLNQGILPDINEEVVSSVTKPVPRGSNGKSQVTDTHTIVRYPQTIDEFVAAARLIGLDRSDLEAVADVVDPLPNEEISDEADVPEAKLISEVEQKYNEMVNSEEFVLSASEYEIQDVETDKPEKQIEKSAMPDLDSMKFHELKELAREFGIEYTRSTTKMDLLMLLTRHYQEQ